MAFETVGSIALFIVESFDNIPAGVSGNMVDIVDMSRINVQNFTNDSIDPNSIPEKYRSAIVNFSKADVIDLINSQGDNVDAQLGELSTSASTNESAVAYRQLANESLKYIGRGIRYSKSYT